MKAVGFDTPTASRNAHRSTPSTSAQTNEIVPWSMLGGLRWSTIAILVEGTKSSPSRLRFRPPSRPTFRFRVLPPDPVSTYSRSVLGASGNLDGPIHQFKRGRDEKPRNLRGSCLAPSNLT